MQLRVNNENDFDQRRRRPKTLKVQNNAFATISFDVDDDDLGVEDKEAHVYLLQVVLLIVVDSFDVATIMKWIVNSIFQKTFPGFASSRPTRAIHR